MANYESLFTPFKINNTEIKNRIVMCAMGGTALFEKGIKETTKAYYIERAKGGVGLIIPGISTITDMWGRDGWLHEEIEACFDDLKAFMDEIHSYDCKLFVQLGAGMGRALSITSAMFIPGCDTVKAMNGPSEGLPNVWIPEKKHRELSIDEIHAYVKEFGLCAKLLKDAGVDGVEVHAVHEGYLLDQFAIEATNWRKDEYGGSLENRLRFPCEIVKEIKKVCGEDYPVSLRYSVASKMKGFNSGALPFEPYKEFGRSLEESPAVAKILEDAGYDMLNVDNGSYDSWYWAHPPMYMPQACNLPDAAFIKKYVNIPVCCAGRMENMDESYPAIVSGEIDAIGVARQFLADPYWPNKLKEGNRQDIKPCIACQNACFGLLWGAGTRCAINACAMREKEYELTPVENAKNIVVVGGGIGGMEVSMVLAKRGHNVTLYEKSDKLGGAFIAAAAPSFKEADKELLKWYERELKKYSNIEVCMNHEVTNIEELEADEIILAVGATPRTVNIPGSDVNTPIEAIEYLTDKKSVGNSAVVIGGGLTGCEIAYDLALKGKEVSVVEMLDDILQVKELAAPNSSMLRDLLKYHKVNVITGAKVTEITNSGIRYEKGGENFGILADSVITSIGYVPHDELKEKYENNEKIHILGDAAFVGNLKHVVWAAWDLGKKL